MIMNNAIPAQAIVAIATVLAALITGMIAMVNLTLSKEQKISELRQAWIDGLREELSMFLSGVRFATVAVHTHYDGIDNNIEFPYPATSEQTSGIRISATETLYRIKLRLNKAEENHIELERLLDSVVTHIRSDIVDNDAYLNNILNSLELITNQSRIILKTEWERVKRGEKAFINLKRRTVPLIVVLTTIFVLIILLAKFA